MRPFTRRSTSLDATWRVVSAGGASFAALDLERAVAEAEDEGAGCVGADVFDAGGDVVALGHAAHQAGFNQSRLMR